MLRSSFLSSALALVSHRVIGSRPFVYGFPGNVSAIGWRVYDRKPFYSFNPSEVMPAASIIKILILDTVCSRIERGRASWNETIPIAAPLIVAASPTFGSARAGERATIEALAAAMIEESDNTAANVLATFVSFASVNLAAQRRDLPVTRLRRHFMDFSARKRGIDNTTSASDMANLLRQLSQESRSGENPASTMARRIIGFMLRQTDRETIPAAIRRRVPIANKTGELPDVRHDVAIVDPYGARPYVSVVMSCRLRDREIAFKDLVRIAANIDSAYRSGDRGDLGSVPDRRQIAAFSGMPGSTLEE